MKKAITVLFAWQIIMGYHGLYAQVQDIKQQINQIKLDENFVYGEAENKDESIAYKMAVNDLKSTLTIIGGPMARKINEPDFCNHIQMLSYERGELKNVFVYVQLVETTAKIAELPKTIDNNEGKVVTSKPEMVVMKEDDFTTDIIRGIMEREMVDDVYRYLESQQTAGVVKSVKIARSLEEIPDDAIIIIYDKSYSVAAVLLQQHDKQRANALTRKPDNIRNYSGHGVLYFELLYGN